MLKRFILLINVKMLTIVELGLKKKLYVPLKALFLDTLGGGGGGGGLVT